MPITIRTMPLKIVLTSHAPVRSDFSPSCAPCA